MRCFICATEITVDEARMVDDVRHSQSVQVRQAIVKAAIEAAETGERAPDQFIDGSSALCISCYNEHKGGVAT